MKGLDKKCQHRQDKGFSFALDNHRGNLNPDESFAFFGSSWPVRHLGLQSHVVGAVTVFYTANVFFTQV